MSSQEGFEFRGAAKEWFGIWIVNLLLSVLTLGIYSAWAKVRTKKYFYQNTWVAGRNFDYHDTGKQILIGRLIVIAALFAYALAAAFSPPLAVIIILAIFICMPVLIVRSAKFNARNSSWRNVRFNFDGETGDAYRVYMGIPILVALSLYTTFPFLDRAIQRFAINGHSLGKTRFHFDSPIGPFCKIFLLAAVFGVVGIVGYGFYVIPSIMDLQGNTGLDAQSKMITTMTVGYVFLLVMVVLGGVIYTTLLRNIVYAATTLGPNQHGYRSTISVGPMLWLALSNALVVICTLGLMLPWAQVRLHRYVAQNTALLPNGTLEEFEGEIISDTNAIGDAYSDIEGIDLDIAL
ncbi:YjgN family protein [Pseudophaeobacter sp.]|uniref:YjgN family protein n=1 Tax=Pseudophaeobacter sp. TaxID=1971739 RepID=UPI003297E818